MCKIILHFMALLCLVLPGCSVYQTPEPLRGADKNASSIIELTVWLWPGTGLERLINQYDEQHQELKINIQISEFRDVHDNLQIAFAAGSGAPDICLVETVNIDLFKSFPARFHNLFTYGGAAVKGDYLDWKWQQAQQPDGSFLYGMPTDIGPIAMIYRTDLFKLAGLPTDREEVSRLINSWDALLESGKTVRRKTGKAMFDNLTNVYRSGISQLDTLYFDKQTDQFIADQNPGVKKVWANTAEAAANQLSAGIPSWTPEWEVGANTGEFAVILAPAWMMGFIKENAPYSAGKWDITRLPEGSGNWGGSFLTMPKEGRHPKESFQLIQWLTAPEQQLETFIHNGNFPSTPAVFDNKQIKQLRDEFFNGAPVGEIYSQAAKSIKPVYEGRFLRTASEAFNEAVQKLETQSATPEQAWREAIIQIEQSLQAY